MHALRHESDKVKEKKKTFPRPKESGESHCIKTNLVHLRDHFAALVATIVTQNPPKIEKQTHVKGPTHAREREI